MNEWIYNVEIQFDCDNIHSQTKENVEKYEKTGETKIQNGIVLLGLFFIKFSLTFYLNILGIRKFTR